MVKSLLGLSLALIISQTAAAEDCKEGAVITFSGYAAAGHVRPADIFASKDPAQFVKRNKLQCHGEYHGGQLIGGCDGADYFEHQPVKIALCNDSLCKVWFYDGWQDASGRELPITLTIRRQDAGCARETS